jgi:hypothetical protein
LISVNGNPLSTIDGKVNAIVSAKGESVPFTINGIKLPDGSTPSTVTMQVTDYDGTVYTVPMTLAANGTWTTTWIAPPGPAGTVLTITLLAFGPTGQTITQVGTITRFDPSGQVFDAVKGCTVIGARVTLERLIGGNWVFADPRTKEGGLTIMDPAVNPQFSGSDGSYGWDVVAGEWRVQVEHDGYQSQTSRVVTVPPPVTDLHVFITPTGVPGSGCARQSPPPLAPLPPNTGAPAAAVDGPQSRAPGALGAFALLGLLGSAVAGQWARKRR